MSPRATSRTSALMRGIRTTAAFRQLVPQEAGIGWPLPERHNGTVRLVLPFFGMARAKERGEVPVHAPFATMTLDWLTARPIGYRDLVAEGLWETRDAISKFPHAAVAGLRRGEYLDRRERLLAMYDELLARLETHDIFEPAWIDAFSHHLTTLLDPAFVPYYRQLGSGFVDRFIASASGQGAVSAEATV